MPIIDVERSKSSLNTVPAFIMAFASPHTAPSQLQYFPLKKSKLQNKILQSSPRVNRHPTLGGSVSTKNSVGIKENKLPPRKTSSATNLLRFYVGDVIINSPNACQQKSSGPEIISKKHGVSGVSEERRIGNGSDGDGNNGQLPPAGAGGGGGGGGGGGCGGGRGEDDKDFDEEKFGPILKFEDVMREVENNGVTLPSDMKEVAKTEGIRSEFFRRYLDTQRIWPLSYLMSSCSIFRNRVLADPSFLFKVGAEIVIDAGSATFAKIQNRGKDFWSEFEIYTADILVGVIVNVALVGMLAPYARMGPMASVSGGFSGQLQLAFASLPSSVFEAGSQGFKFSFQQRIAAYFYKSILFGALGFGRGLICHGNRNTKKSEDDASASLAKRAALLYLIMTRNRNTKNSEKDAPVSLVKWAALRGVFLAVSANTRYQIVNGLEQLVQSSPMAKQVPSVALAFTVGIRFANNIYGGLQFSDWAEWSGIMKREL